MRLMKRAILIIAVLMTFTINLKAQDKIIKLDGDTINCKVSENKLDALKIQY